MGYLDDLTGDEAVSKADELVFMGEAAEYHSQWAAASHDFADASWLYCRTGLTELASFYLSQAIRCSRQLRPQAPPNVAALVD